MIIGIGTDIFEVKRMKKRIEKETSFIQGFFTEKEISYCEQFRFKEQNYAARFAAKEAFMKALGTGYNDGIGFKEIEITNTKTGKPEISLTGKALAFAKKSGITNIHVSLVLTKKDSKTLTGRLPKRNSTINPETRLISVGIYPTGIASWEKPISRH